MTKVKICGLKKLEHMLTVTELGADFLGFVFVEGVRREISPDDAHGLINQLKQNYTGKLPKLVGLFANQDSSYVNQIVNYCDLDMVQLCGDEDSEYWAKINSSIIKQVKMEVENHSEYVLNQIKQKVDEIRNAGHMPLLDSYERGALGGTGKTFDWSMTKLVSGNQRLILAGGLTPANVNQAINMVRPWAVDVSSGVETNGQKDDLKLRDFINNAFNASK
ncbi:MAG: N-(5'-phosphoribosyl)anthranilate isomerase [Dehalococcoidia bacterium]|nr:N-(5'-phosphoribosyl)anthranilate isomerase [Dehalococcoidia bacterium]MQG16453.1 phosphoribosylanthranilate isomerase [SAR202 cluster bacterium]